MKKQECLSLTNSTGIYNVPRGLVKLYHRGFAVTMKQMSIDYSNMDSSFESSVGTPGVHAENISKMTKLSNVTLTYYLLPVPCR